MSDSCGLWKSTSSYSRYLLTSHVRPDPDAVGSEIALALFLEKLGKECRIVNEGALPKSFSFLPHHERVLACSEDADFDFEAVICLDAPDVARAGKVAHVVGSAPLFIVDHHPYRNNMADFAWIDPAASSTGEMLYTFMSRRRDLIDADIATCLYAAIMTDTGRFTYSNTSRQTLQAAADLVGLGARPAVIAQGYYENRTDGQVHLLGCAASGVRRAAGGAVAYTTLSAEDFDRAGVGPEAAHELAELPRTLEGVKIAVLLRDIDGNTKVSLRSKGPTSVKEAAEHFGGGGHHAAAGFFLELPLAEAEILVIRYLEDYLTARQES